MLQQIHKQGVEALGFLIVKIALRRGGGWFNDRRPGRIADEEEWLFVLVQRAIAAELSTGLVARSLSNYSATAAHLLHLAQLS